MRLENNCSSTVCVVCVQYMVVDLKRFQPRKQLQDGLLWLVEQLPGMVEAADMTNTLSRGYCE